MKRIRHAGAAACLLACFHTTGAHARDAEGESDDMARQRFQKGVEFYNAGDFEAALAEFTESYRVKSNWAVKYNIAFCYMKTNHYVRSMKEFRAYLEMGEGKISEKRKEHVEKILEELNGKIGKIGFCCDLGPIDVVVDDVEKHAIDGDDEIMLDPGVHKIAVMKEDFEEHVEEVMIVSGKKKTLEVQLNEVPSAAAAAGGSSPFPEESPGPSGIPAETVKKREREPGWLWGGLVTGGVLGAASIVCGALVLKKKDELDRETDDCPVTLTRDNCPTAYALSDEGSELKLATNILLAGALVAGAIGLIGYLAGRKSTADEKSGGSAPVSLHLAGGEIAISVRF